MPTNEFHPHVWGYIQDLSGVKTPYDQTGTPNNQWVNNGTIEDRRAFWSFDTSSILTAATISSIDFVWRLYSVGEEMTCEVAVYAVKLYYEPDRIGPSIDVSDWGLLYDAGGLLLGIGVAPSPGQKIISLGVGNINKTGDSDYELRGNNLYSGCADGAHYEVDTYSGGIFRVFLRVEYNIPQGVLTKFGLGNIGWHGPLSLPLLTQELVFLRVISPHSRVLGFTKQGLSVTTDFMPRVR